MDEYEDDIGPYISEVNKEELINYLYQGYSICIGSNCITLLEIFRGRKRLTEDDIRALPEIDKCYGSEYYEIEIDESIKYIEIWL